METIANAIVRLGAFESYSKSKFSEFTEIFGTGDVPVDKLIAKSSWLNFYKLARATLRGDAQTEFFKVVDVAWKERERLVHEARSEWERTSAHLLAEWERDGSVPQKWVEVHSAGIEARLKCEHLERAAVEAYDYTIATAWLRGLCGNGGRATG